jgi:hypothetical protein
MKSDIMEKILTDLLAYYLVERVKAYNQSLTIWLLAIRC